MASGIFDRETLLDLTVNIIPLGIIAFFVVAFAVYNPFQGEPIYLYLQYVLLIAPFVALAILTYYSAKAIEGDARKHGTEHLDAGAPLSPAAQEAEQEPALEEGSEGEDDATADADESEPLDEGDDEDEAKDEE